MYLTIHIYMHSFIYPLVKQNMNRYFNLLLEALLLLYQCSPFFEANLTKSNVKIVPHVEN